MARLIVSEYLSLDGVLQAPGHEGEDTEGGFAHGGWTSGYMRDHMRLNSVSVPSAGAFLFGRRTYEIFAQVWPTVTDEGNQIAAALNSKPKYVASRTLRNPHWPGTTVIRDVRSEVTALTDKPGPPILVLGSSGLAQTLIESDLVDAYELWLHPVILGGGKKLFRDGAPRSGLRLADSRTTGDGLVILTYERAG